MVYRFTLSLFLLAFVLDAGAQKTGSKVVSGKTNSSNNSVNSVKSSPSSNSGVSVKSPIAKKLPGAAAPSTTTAHTKVDTKLLESGNSGKDNVSGIWKGYFVQSTFGITEDKYRFEVQLDKLLNNAIKGVTYSYKTTVFYGKAEATGIYTKKTENVLLKELRMVDLKMTEANSSACLMTCYLEYAKIGSIETLSGTYTSISVKDKSECGSGKVYLEKTTTSDFYKEDFILKKENELRNKAKEESPKPSTVKKGSPSNKVAAPPAKKIIKPGSEDDLIVKNPVKESDAVLDSEPKNTVNPSPKEAPRPLPKPEVIISRDNELVKTITTNQKSIKIDLYDNGEIDGDRISVYHNNKLIVSNQLLTDKPISFTFNADEKDASHEFVMVADNLGSIPPNTSLMIITAGDKRYELFVTSTEQKNAVVKIVYEP